MRHKKNKIVHFLIFGSIYLNIEVVFRAAAGVLIGVQGISKWSLCGWTSLWMFPIGGFCAVIIGSFNDKTAYYNLKMWQQVIMGGSFIIAVELLTGLFFNVCLNLSIWNYCENRFNFMGQVCLLNSILWYFLSVIVIWLDDALSHYYYGDDKPGSLLSYFKKVFTLQ